MRKLLFAATLAALMLTTSVAHATTVTRSGLDYSGTRNPGGCTIMADAGDLHVSCLSKRDGATGPAFIRYRFLADVGAVREDATVSADITTWVGQDCFIEWMIRVPHTAARTARITVPFGSYCHIASVSWTQSPSK